MKEFAKFLGWISVAGFGLAFLNYIVKIINKKYLKEMPSKYKNIYKFVMKNIVKYHKNVGLLAGVALIIHFIVMVNLKGLRFIGLGAMVMMIITILLGIYGAYIKKKSLGLWRNIHKVTTFISILLIAFHVLTKL